MEIIKKQVTLITTEITGTTGATIVPDTGATYNFKINLTKTEKDLGYFDSIATVPSATTTTTTVAPIASLQFTIQNNTSNNYGFDYQINSGVVNNITASPNTTEIDFDAVTNPPSSVTVDLVFDSIGVGETVSVFFTKNGGLISSGFVSLNSGSSSNVSKTFTGVVIGDDLDVSAIVNN